MSSINSRGLVLKEVNVGEADKILTILMKEHGKVSVSAKGARKTNSKFLSAAQLFCYADFVVYSGKGFRSLASAQPIESFFGISADYEKLCAGAYVLELAEKILLENENCDGILYLLLLTLKNLEKGAHGPEIIKSVFELKFLQLNGYSPEVSVCAECGGEIGSKIFLRGDGVICGGCVDTRDEQKFSYGDIYDNRPEINISAGCLNAIRYILGQEIKSIFSFKTDKKTGSELINAAGFFLNAHMDVKLKSSS